MPQMTPDSSFSQAWLLWQLVLLAGAIAPSLLLWRKLSGKAEVRQILPSPLEVKQADQYVTKAECVVQHNGVMDRLTRMEATLAALQAARHTDLESLRHDMRGDVQRIHERIDALPDRIIATLKNTGAIE